MSYKITLVNKYSFVIKFQDFGFIEYWKGHDIFYTNIFEHGIERKTTKKIIRIFKRTLFLYKLGLLRRR